MGNGVKNRIAVIVGGAEPWQIQYNAAVAKAFAEQGYRVFVSSPTLQVPADKIERAEPGTGAGLGVLVKELKKVVDDEDELLVMTFAHGGNPPCLELQDTCYPADGEAFRDLFSLPHAKRTVIMKQCSSGNWVDFFVSDPRTLFISSGSRNAITSTLDLEHLLDPDNSVPDRDGNGTITWSERFAHTMALGSGASPTFIAGRDYVDTGLSGKAPEPPHYPARAQVVSTIKDYRAQLATLKPGDHAVVAVIKDGDKKSLAYRATFDRLAREARGHSLFLIIEHGDAREFSEELKSLNVNSYPAVILSDYRAYKVALTSVEATHNPLSYIARVYSNVQTNPSYWIERLEKDAPAWWPRVPEEFRNNPEIWKVLQRYCANQPSCPKDNKTQMSRFIFSEAVQRHPEIFRESPLLIQNIPLEPEFSEVRKGVWKILKEKGLTDVWHELSDEFRADPALRAILSENGQNADAAFRSIWLESIRKYPDAYPQDLILSIPSTPEWNDVRREAWRLAVRWNLKCIWNTLSPEQRRDPVLFEVLAERGKKVPTPMSWELRLGGGPAYDTSRNAYTHLGIDLRWKPFHLADDKLYLGVMLGADVDVRTVKMASGHEQTYSYGSVKFGATLEWGISNFMLGATPFVSTVTAEQTELYANGDKHVSNTISSAQSAGIGMEISVQYLFGDPSFSPYLGFGTGFYSSYAYRRLLGRKEGAPQEAQHQISGGLVFWF